MNEAGAKILFVDDEKSILSSLRRLMFDEPWECQFVQSAKEALTFLEKNAIDLVVSDVVMPEMDGIEFLAEVQRRYPSIIRIFLTGFARQENVTRALTEGYSQQIIPKPWLDQELKDVIRSALRQSDQQKKHGPKFQELINSIPLLPPLPKSYSQVQDCIIGEEVDIEKMVDLISRDVAITSALLHWANSALFGQRFRVDTVKKAIVVLGTNIVKSLILSESVNRTLAGNLPTSADFDLLKFKCHSIATATMSCMLIKSLHGSDVELQDRAFIAGLLHDMGKLTAASFFSEKFAAAVEKAKESSCSYYEAEKELLGTDHAELGSFLAEWWTLPPYITNAIRWHHEPIFGGIDQEVVSAVHVANLLSHQFGYGDDGEKTAYEIAEEYRESFYLTDERLEILQVETGTILKALCCRQ